ncbi:MAG: hypothetical protein ACJAYU_005330 [Bradymonadia bacterium]
MHALAAEAVARDYLAALVGPSAWPLMPTTEGLDTLSERFTY